MARRKAFTLIELLVVVSIIALLISLLLPALGKAKKSAQQAKSLSNLRQIGIASASYRTDQKGYFPIVGTANRGQPPISDPVTPWATWSFGGKNNDSWWFNGFGIYDIEAADRPLNPYLYPEVRWEAPNPPQRLPANSSLRTAQQAEAFRDPSDSISHQRNHPQPNTVQISSYDDVGTSYHWNARMTPYIMQRVNPPDRLPPGMSPAEADGSVGFHWMTNQLRIADTYLPSTFVWVFDETPDLVCNQSNFDIINGYGDKNKGVLGFIDGHAAYLPLLRGRATGPGYTLQWTFQNSPE